MPVRPRSLILFVVWLAIALVFGVALWRSRMPPNPPLESLASFQDADAPLLLPADGKPEYRLQRSDAWQRVTVPHATRFDLPLGSEHGALTYNAQPFGAMNEARGGNHHGDDLNGIGGMNTDLGDPVFAPADGLVVFAGEPSPGWGKTLVIAHRLPDGCLLQSMLAHLERIDVACGALVARGARVGSVGTANGNYPAHLHFELRESDGVEIGAGYGANPLNRRNPGELLATLHAAAPEALDPAVLARVLALPKEPWSRLQIQGAERLSEILGQDPPAQATPNPK
jgi:murein DD-endopeptidase MepM/ murein hydrolase activator NlpD